MTVHDYITKNLQPFFIGTKIYAVAEELFVLIPNEHIEPFNGCQRHKIRCILFMDLIRMSHVTKVQGD